MVPADWAHISDALDRGGLVILPSDTVYGLACLATLPEAVERIYEVKGRQPDKPVALVFSSVEQIIQLIPDLPLPVRTAVSALLPGPVTAIVPFVEGTGGIHVRGGGSIGVRIIPPPEGDLYTGLPGPLAVTSANLSGGNDPSLVCDIPEEIIAACEYVVDNGRCEHRIPSTVVDLRPLASGGSPAVLRAGVMTAREIEERLA